MATDKPEKSENPRRPIAGAMPTKLYEPPNAPATAAVPVDLNR